MGDTTFKERVIPHDKFVLEVKRNLTQWGYDVIDNGRERRNPEWNGIALDSGLFRFAPDLAVRFGNKIIYIDPKTSKYIERAPYEEYMKLYSLRESVIVVAAYDDKVKFSRIEKIVFIPPWHKIWPIVDGWITPRAHPEYEYYKYNYYGEGKGYRGAGTPFNMIDTRVMIEWGPMFFQWYANG